MKNISQKIAALLAFFIGLMSVIVGLRVLLEIDTKDYNVLVWLVTYNVIFGAISIVVSYFIWKNKAKSKSLVLFILATHIAVFLYLKFVSFTAASESINAMIFRTSIWFLIIILSILIPKYIKKNQK